MIVEGLQFEEKKKPTTQDTMLTCLDFSEELQLHLRMSTLVPILSFDNQ